MIATESPFPQYFDTDGTALDAGYIYFGVAGQNPETSPITVYWDFAGTTPAAQPIRTSNGYTVRDGTPAVVYATGDYSLTVRKKTGALVYSAPSSAYFGNAYSLSQLGANLAASSGSSLVGFLQSGAGATARTSQDKLRDSVSINDFLPAGFSAANDATAYIQSALSSGAATVDFLNLALKCDAVTVPANVTAKNVNFTKYNSAAGSIILVNSGCRVTGKLTGTGITNAIQRGIYPAADGVTDVQINVEVSNLTVGVQAQNIGAYTSANYPRRWSGRVYAHDIVGAAGVSEGYGLLLSPAWDCQFTVVAKNIARHAVYLSAGAKSNAIDVDVDNCSNIAVQLFSTAVQDPTTLNTVRVKARNLAQNVATQSGAVGVIQNAHRNTVTVDAEGNGVAYNAVTVQGSSGGPYPLANKIIDCSISGQWLGGDVVNLINADSTTVARNRIDAYATVSAIASRTSGTNGSTHSGYFFDNQINCQAQNCIGIYDEVTSAPASIGLNDIRNTGTSLRVSDATGGKRRGFSRRVTFGGTTASITNAQSGDTVVTLPDSIQTAGRSACINITGSSGTFFNAMFWASPIAAPSETQLTFRAYNGGPAAQTLTYAGWVEGD